MFQPAWKPCLRGTWIHALLLSTLATSTMHPAPAAAAVLDPGGLPVCAASGDQLNPRAAPAADGAAIVVWQDQRRGSPTNDIYALSVAANGTVTPGWPADGRPLCASGNSQLPIAVSDGAGGALVFWWDGRDQGQIYAQRVNADGTIASGWPANGKAITTFGGDFVTAMQQLDAVPDGAGGAYLTWPRAPAFEPSIGGAVTRITADGNFAPGWTESGVLIGPPYTPHGVDGCELSVDPAAGVFFSAHWYKGEFLDRLWGGTVARISSAGAVTWTRHVPVHWSFGPSNIEGTQAITTVADGAGGCFASWWDYYYVHPQWVYGEFVQHYNSAGNPLWPTDTPSPAHQSVASDEAGGVYLIGCRVQESRLDVHRWLGDGSVAPGWSPSGINVSQPVAMGAIARSNFDGSLFVCWSENRTGGGFDIRGIAIDASGTVVAGWDPNGTLVSGASGDQQKPALSDMGPGRALACWQDRRTGGWDIRATRLGNLTTDAGPGLTRASVLQIGEARPNPARTRARFAISLADGGEASATVLDVGGRVVRDLGSVGPGASFEVDLGGLADGIYWLAVEQAGRREARRFAVLR